MSQSSACLCVPDVINGSLPPLRGADALCSLNPTRAAPPSPPRRSPTPSYNYNKTSIIHTTTTIKSTQGKSNKRPGRAGLTLLLSPRALPTLFTPAVRSSSSRSRRWPSSSSGSQVTKLPPRHLHSTRCPAVTTAITITFTIVRCPHPQNGDRPPCQHPPLTHYAQKHITLASTAPHDSLHFMATHPPCRTTLRQDNTLPQPQTDRRVVQVTDAHTQNTRNQITIVVSEAAASSPSRHVGNTW